MPVTDGFLNRDMTEREINALRLHGALNPGRTYAWWMYGEEWKWEALRRYDEMCVIFKKTGD